MNRRCLGLAGLALAALMIAACGWTEKAPPARTPAATAAPAAPVATAATTATLAAPTVRPAATASVVAGTPTKGPTPVPVSLKLGYSAWVGYGPLFIARDKGYFKSEGLDVGLIKVDDPRDRFTAVNDKQLDGLASTLDTLTLFANADTPLVVILGLDDSSGGDGMVVRKDKNINTLKDLKGKNVGVNTGTVSHFLLDFLLQTAGLTDSDVTLVNVAQADVPGAIASGHIDAGVTWEPYLSASTKDPNVKLLVTSKDAPGVIADVLIMRKDILAANPDIGRRLVRAWDRAVEYEKANRNDAATVMQTGLGGYYQKPQDILDDLAGITLYDKARNAQFFDGNGAGTALGTIQLAIDLRTRLGQISTPIKAEDMIDASYLEK